MLGAQAEPYYDGMDDRYDSYEPTYLPNNEDYDNEYTPDEDGRSYYNEEPYSYGDSYSDDMYSEYPTKDKKFECEEGPFTGFFVSDPIFCDVELPAGPPGPRGQTGPAGVFDFDSTYIVEQDFGPLDITPGSQSSVGANIECDDGDVVISGGYSSPDADPSNLHVSEDRPFKNEFFSTSGWSVIAGVTGPVEEMNFIAYCFDNPPLRTSASAAAVSAFQQPSVIY